MGVDTTLLRDECAVGTPARRTRGPGKGVRNLQEVVVDAPMPVANALDLPTPWMAEQALADAHRAFSRNLAGWATDLLRLRHRGLADASWAGSPSEADPYGMAA